MSSAIRIQIWKEARALLPWWLGVTAVTVTTALILSTASGRRMPFDGQLWFLIAYGAGMLSVSALSLGQELTHGTLSALLVQPVARRRVLWTKLAVLIAMATALALLVEWLYPRWEVPRITAGRPLRIWLPALLSIGLVPVVTVLTRKPLAGVIFPIVVPGTILAISNGLYPLEQGTQALTITWYGTLIVCVCGFGALLYLFPKLQVTGDGPVASQSPRFREATVTGVASTRSAAPTRRHWIWNLVRKEFRLQHLTLAVSAVLGLLGVGIVIMQRTTGYAGAGVGSVAVLHGIFIAIIAGSRASAEERHLGVLSMQMLQPKASWRQWTIKVIVTLSLAVGMAIAFTYLFVLANADAVVTPTLRLNPASDWFGMEPGFFVGVGLACVAALYVSSLSSNSLWALLGCFLAAGIVLIASSVLNSITLPLRARNYGAGVDSWITEAMRQNNRDDGWRVLHHKLDVVQDVEAFSFLIVVTGLVLLGLYLAGRNHRSLERAGRLVTLQLCVIALYLAVAIAVSFGASRIAWSI